MLVHRRVDVTHTLPDRDGAPLYHVVPHDLFMALISAYVRSEVTEEELEETRRELADPTTEYFDSADVMKMVDSWKDHSSEMEL